MEYENIPISEDELAHHGIRGMKWGIRRFQNKDGTLTKAGQKRYKDEMDKLKSEEQTLKNRKATQAKLDRLAAKKKSIEDQKKELDGTKTKAKDSEKEEKPVKKSVKDMSDIELANAVNRARLEDAYLQLRPEQVAVEKNPMMKQLVEDVVKPAAVNAGKRFAENAMNKMADNLLEGKEDPNSLSALNKIRDKLKTRNEIASLENALKRAKSDVRGDLDAKDQKTLWDLDRAKKNAKAEEDAAKAEKKAARDKAARDKAEADEAARQANEAKSMEYYNSFTQASSAGRSKASNAILSLPPAVSNIPAESISSGKSRVSEVIDSDGSVIRILRDDD